jgi:hypothetical protein
MDVAADLDGNVYVADRENHVVQVIVLTREARGGKERAQTNKRTVQELHTCELTPATPTRNPTSSVGFSCTGLRGGWDIFEVSWGIWD